MESNPLPDETRIALHLLSDGYLIYILNQYSGASVCCGQKTLSSGHPVAVHCIQRKVCKMACKIQLHLASVLPSPWPHYPGIPVSCVPTSVFPGITQTLLPTSHPPLPTPHPCPKPCQGLCFCCSYLKCSFPQRSAWFNSSTPLNLYSNSIFSGRLFQTSLYKTTAFSPILSNTFLCYIFLFSLKTFIYFWLHWASVAACSLSPVAESGGYTLVAGCRLLSTVFSVVEESGSRALGLQ